MDVVFWIAQGIGAVGLFFAILVFQMRERDAMFMAKIIAAGAFAIHFWLLGAETGALMNILVVVRTAVFKERTHHKWADHTGFLLLFLAVGLGLTSLTWEGPISILPLAGITFSSFAFWSITPRTVRIISIFTAVSWLIYDALISSYPGMIVELCSFASVLIGIARHDIRKGLNVRQAV